MVKVIKKVLEDHKRSWDSHMKYVVWENRVLAKISTSKSPYQLVYGIEAIFPTYLSFRFMKFLQESYE